MTAQFYYTDHFEVDDSAVVEAVYYNRDTYELFVVTNRDDAYGYKSVPNYTFNHFRNAVSKGHFWNTAIKGTYANFSRGAEVDFFDRNPVTTPAAAKSVYADVNSANPTPAPDEYVVTFEISGTLTITGTADGYDDAVAKATKIVNEQLAGNFKVKDVKKNQ